MPEAVAAALKAGLLGNTKSHRDLSVFISHSSKDAAFALALIELLKAALGFSADQIRCSSVDGYRLPVGANTESKLRKEVNAAKIVIGLITPSSLMSHFVMFELGARWGASHFLAPLLAGVKPSELSGPLSLLNALSAHSEAQLHQLLTDVSTQLGLRLQNAASYVRYVSAVKTSADGMPTGKIKGVNSDAAKKPREHNTKVQPNLQPQAPELAALYLNRSEETWTEHPTSHATAAEKVIGILIPISNIPKSRGRTVAKATHIKGKLVWYVDGRKRCTAYPSAWVDHEFNTVHIAAQTKKIVIAVESNNQEWAAVTQHRGFHDRPSAAMTFERLPEVEKDGKGTMELQIIKDDGEKIETLETFTYQWWWVSGRKPQLRLLQSAD